MKKKFTYIVVVSFFVFIAITAQVFRSYLLTNKKGKTKNNSIKNWVKPDEEYLNYYGLDSFETNLPIVYISTDDKILKEEKVWATIAVNDYINGEMNSIMDLPDYEADIMINYRGASSYSHFDKKQYRIKFYKNKGSSNPKKYDFLGMGKHSEWVLNGPFLDKTLIRNHLAYGLGAEIFDWTPNSRFIELFVDGEYRGVYLAVQPITNGETRLGLSEFGLVSGATAYIVKRDRVDTEDLPLDVYGSYAGKTFNSLYLEYPSKKDVTDKQLEWITNDIDQFEKALYSDDFANDYKGYKKYIDVANFVDYYIFNEVMMNYDAGNLSTYAYKELEGKLKLTIWDYNNAFDNYQWFAINYDEFLLADNSWFSRLIQDREFVDLVVKRYRQLRETTFNEEYIYGQIDRYVEELGPAIDRNFAVWEYTFHENYMSNINDVHISAESYEQAIEQLKTSIHLRFQFLDAHIEDLYEGCIN